MSDRYRLDLVMTGWAGLTAGKRLALEHEELLRQTLTERFLAQLQQLPENAEGVPAEAENLQDVAWSREKKLPDGTVVPPQPMAVPVEEGGVFEALWKLADMAGAGLNVVLADVPVRQETIEVCEVVDVNPYQLPSGCWLYLSEHGNDCPGRVIGRTHRGKARTITGAEGVRYLEKPRH